MEKLQIGPVEIRHTEFSTQMFGYKKEEVDEFLEIVASQMEDLLFANSKKTQPKKETSQNNAEVAKPEPKIEPSEIKKEIVDESDFDFDKIELPTEKSIEVKPEIKVEKPLPKQQKKIESDESLISKTLILAEKMKEDIIANAEADAEEILAKAHEKADNLVIEAKRSLINMESEYRTIKDMKIKYLNNIRSDLQVILDRIEQKSLLKKDIENQLDEKFDAIADALREPKGENDD